MLAISPSISGQLALLLTFVIRLYKFTILTEISIFFPQERIQSLEKQLNEANKQLTRLEVLEQVSWTAT